MWKKKHETGQWLEIEAAEAMSSRPDFSAMNASGIILSSVANESHTELASENNGKSSGVTSASKSTNNKFSKNCQLNLLSLLSSCKS